MDGERLKDILDEQIQAGKQVMLQPELREPFERAGAYIQQIHNTLLLSTYGIDQAAIWPTMIENLIRFERERHNVEESLNNLERNLEEANERASFARPEQERGYPTLHAQATVALWTALETCVHDAVVRWLLVHPEDLYLEEVQKVSVKLGTFIALDRDQQLDMLVEVLRHQKPRASRGGVTLFNGLLSVFGLTFPVSEAVSLTLFELGHVRNAIVHRAGIVDRKMERECPSLCLAIGESIVVDQARYLGFKASVRLYLQGFISKVDEVDRSKGVKNS